MAEHFENFVDHIMSDDDSELGKVKAERDYALHCLEREIAICAQTQERNDALVKALEKIVAEGGRTGYGKIALVRTAKAALNAVVGRVGTP